jgi:transcriptional regulator with PAS, ATPase and Fis domain
MSSKKNLVLDGIIGESPAIERVLDMVERVSQATTTTVLILGESGTGKEVIARAIHKNSPTAEYPFISVSCAAIPSTLLESELFGYERGAFTDAKIQKKGLLELADHGTLFFDEIDLMGLDLQAKLLNVLETRTFRRIGGTREITVNLRFIAATNEDLDKAVKKGTFRKDLYYRLYVVPISLPPLRERGDDILLIADYYLEHYGQEHGHRHQSFTPEARAVLKSYDWPGNVRELKNVIERAVLMARTDAILPEDLSINQRVGSDQLHEPGAVVPVTIEGMGSIRVTFPPWGISLEEVERQIIAEALKATRGNVSGAAHLLHISRDTLRYRIKKYGLTVGDFT